MEKVDSQSVDNVVLYARMSLRDPSTPLDSSLLLLKLHLA